MARSENKDLLGRPGDLRELIHCATPRTLDKDSGNCRAFIYFDTGKQRDRSSASVRPGRTDIRSRRTCEWTEVDGVVEFGPELADRDHGHYEGQRRVDICKGRLSWKIFFKDDVRRRIPVE